MNQQLSNKEGRSGAMQASLSVSVAILFKIVWPDLIQVGYKNIKFKINNQTYFAISMSVFISKWKGKNPNLTIMYRVKHSLKELLVHRGSIIQERSSIITSLSLKAPKECLALHKEQGFFKYIYF